MAGHSARIGTLSWNTHVLASGSRDRAIYLRDVRVREPYTSKLTGHKQEVCGLRWSFDGNQLASGGNDNKLFIWSLHASTPVARFNEHTAAVKAIAWSPHQHGLLASGGGTADRCIRFWNTLTGTSPGGGAGLNCVDTGSQVRRRRRARHGVRSCDRAMSCDASTRARRCDDAVCRGARSCDRDTYSHAMRCGGWIRMHCNARGRARVSSSRRSAT